MEENKIVVRSIRADEATLEQFKKISEQFSNQGDALKQLVNLYELDAARAAVPGSADMLEVFRDNLDSIQKSFIYALELKEGAEKRAEESVLAKMEIKDKTIADLQGQKEALKAEIEALTKAKAENELELNVAMETAKKAVIDAQKVESALDTANALVNAKNAEIARLKAEVDEAAQLSANYENLEAEYLKAEAENKKLSETIKTLNFESEQLKAEHKNALQAAELERRAAVLEEREKAQMKLEEKDKEISELSRKISVQENKVPDTVEADEANEEELY